MKATTSLLALTTLLLSTTVSGAPLKWPNLEDLKQQWNTLKEVTTTAGREAANPDNLLGPFKPFIDNTRQAAQLVEELYRKINSRDEHNGGFTTIANGDGLAKRKLLVFLDSEDVEYDDGKVESVKKRDDRNGDFRIFDDGDELLKKRVLTADDDDAALKWKWHWVHDEAGNLMKRKYFWVDDDEINDGKAKREDVFEKASEPEEDRIWSSHFANWYYSMPEN